MSGVKIAMIAAVAENGVIGADNELPWRLPTDFGFYKATTMGKPLIMGRKTFESIGKPLPGRTNIVVTRSSDFAPQGVVVMPTLEAAIAHAKVIAEEAGVDEVFINGGGTIYAQAIAEADRLYITHVKASPDGDVRFPAIDPADWTGTEVSEIVPGERDSHPFTVMRYERRGTPGFH